MATAHDLKRPNFTDERIFALRQDAFAAEGDPGWFDLNAEGAGLLFGVVTVPADRWWKLDSASLVVTNSEGAAVSHGVDAVVALGDADWDLTQGTSGLWYTLGQNTDHTLVQDTLLPCTTNPNVWVPSGWKIAFICGELPVTGTTDRFMVLGEQASLVLTGRAFTLQQD